MSDLTVQILQDIIELLRDSSIPEPLFYNYDSELDITSGFSLKKIPQDRIYLWDVNGCILWLCINNAKAFKKLGNVSLIVKIVNGKAKSIPI